MRKKKESPKITITDLIPGGAIGIVEIQKETISPLEVNLGRDDFNSVVAKLREVTDWINKQ